jgi:hypothetical protein
MTTELDRIFRQMQEAVVNDDTEEAHADADGLLCEALRVLAPDSDVVSAIIDEYDNVGKWYA